MRKRMAKYGLAVSVAALTGALSMMPAAASSGSSSSSSTGSGGMIGSLIMMVLLFAVLQLPAQVLVQGRPHPTAKPQMVSPRAIAVRVGDEIVTIGGIVGLVIRVEDDTIQIETGGDRHKMRIKTWAIQENITVKEDNERAKAAAAEEAKAKKESKKKKKDDEDGVLKD